MARSQATIIFAATLVVNVLLLSQSRFTNVAVQPYNGQNFGTGTSSFRRGLFTTNSDESGENCRPIKIPLKDQCAHVEEECPKSDSFLSIPYIQRYFCAKPAARPWTFAGFIVWLIFLFSTIGISASDFFCPNLATVAQTLGLDENVAGVTFLAFGNGSPDVFSTFSAMRSNTGSLAVGELLGAASFIVSCVVGSMCIIRPFKVEKFPFLRDVGFFFAAVSAMITFLWDGRLLLWEALTLVGLYFTYVCVVVIGSWWERRHEARRAREALIRDEYSADGIPQIAYQDGEPYLDEPYQDEPYRDEPSVIPTSENLGSEQPPTPMDWTPRSRPRARAKSQPGPPRIQTDFTARRNTFRGNPSTRSSSPPLYHPPHRNRHSSISHQMPSFSLIGALEFRQVVASLASQAAGDPLNLHLYQESPLTPYVRGHYPHHHFHSSLSRPRTPEEYPWDAGAGSVQLHERSPRISPNGSVERLDQMIFPSNPTSEADTASHRFTPPSKGQILKHALYRTWHTLFPTLHHFWDKTFLGKIVALFAAPAVMALTITLPVVVTPYMAEKSMEKPSAVDAGSADSRLIDFEEEGVEAGRALIAEEEVVEEYELKYNKWLMAAQCAFGPLWCVAVLFNGTRHEMWLLIATGIAGIAAAILVLIFSTEGKHPTMRILRCSMGFFVAIVWIMAIADEVVDVLRAFGFIFGLSDAIIGVTIFAVGNSLADLVANMSVAVFAPIMGFSACFGGPMLNILLGVGISGSYVISHSGRPYNIPLSPTLLINGLGLLMILLATVVVVPLNGFYLTRAWGIILICCYVALMTVTVAVELRGDLAI